MLHAICMHKFKEYKKMNLGKYGNFYDGLPHKYALQYKFTAQLESSSENDIAR